jgi:hypothetical protein
MEKTNDWQLVRRRRLVWPEKRVLVCGATSYDNWDHLKSVLHYCQPTTILHGHATGVDQLASLYAQIFRINELRFPAQWRVHGIDAALIRNELMFVHGKPHLVVAFPGGINRDDLVRRARRSMLRIIEVNDEGRVETTQPESFWKIRAWA